MNKKMLYIGREKRILFCEFLVPIIMVILGMMFTNMTFFKNAPLLPINIDIYPKQFKINENKSSDDFIKGIPSGFNI